MVKKEKEALKNLESTVLHHEAQTPGGLMTSKEQRVVKFADEAILKLN